MDTGEGERRPRPEGPRGLRPETFRRVATDSCRSASPIASFVSRAMPGGQGPRCAGGRVVTPRIGPEGANRWRGLDPLRHRHKTKAFPRMENRGGLVAHAPAYATPMRGRATISISPRSSGSARDNSSPGRSRPSCRRSILGAWHSSPGPVVFPAMARTGSRAQDQHGGGIPLGPGDGVQAMMHPVDQFDVGVPRWPGQRRVAGRAPAPNGTRGRGGRGTPRPRRADRPADGRRPGGPGACPAAAGPPARRPGRRSRVGADAWRRYNRVGPEGGWPCPAGADPPRPSRGR